MQKGVKSKICRIFREYKSEVIFFIVLVACVLLSFFLASYIPVDFYKDALCSILNGTVATVCLLGAWLLWRHHDGIRVRKLWACVLMVWSFLATLLLLGVMAYNVPVDTGDTISLHEWEMAIGNVYAWLLLLYPTAVLRPGWMNIERGLLQLLPVVIVAVLDYLLPIDLRWLLAIYPVVLLGILIMHVRAYRAWCEENYSSMENIDAQWIVRYLIMDLVNGGAYCVMSWFYTPAHAFTQQWLLLFMLVYSTEQILFRRDPWELVRARAAQAEEEALENAGSVEMKEGEDSSCEVKEGLNPVYREILEKWMQEKKPYRNPDFRLLDLREVLPLNRTYLSQLINAEYGCNFYQFVTNYRIQEAKRLMRAYPYKKMQEIAELSGFSSPTVFSRTFSRETGMSPREWMCNV